MLSRFEAVLQGFTWATAAATYIKAVRQTYMCWHRSGKFNVYIILVWVDITASSVLSIVNWIYQEKSSAGVATLFFMVFLWAVHMQCYSQIIAKRISLIMFDPRRVRRLKCMVAMLIFVINVAVFSCWLPSRILATPSLLRADDVVDRTEKGIFVIFELCINGYFMWLIRSQLVSGGLTKYNILFKFNAAMVSLSVTLDVVILGIMSLRDDRIYLYFCPMFYIMKVNIEMTIAELIAKVATKTPSSSHRQRSKQSRTSKSAVRENGFGSTISYQECLGFGELRRPVGEEMATYGDDDGHRASDDMEMATTACRSESSYPDERRTRDRLDSTVTTEVDWSAGIEKQDMAENWDNCGRTKSRRMSI